MDKIFFDHPIRNELRTYDNTQKMATGQWDDYLTGCFLDCIYFKECYQMIAIDLVK